MLPVVQQIILSEDSKNILLLSANGGCPYLNGHLISDYYFAFQDKHVCSLIISLENALPLFASALGTIHKMSGTANFVEELKGAE